jgi:hypothetical protein
MHSETIKKMQVNFSMQGMVNIENKLYFLFQSITINLF